MTHKTLWVHQYALRDLVDDTFDLFKERATSLLLAGVIPYSLVVIYVFLMRTYVIPGNFLQRFDEDAVMAVLQSPIFWGFLGGLAAVNGIAFSIGHIAQCRIAVAQALGERITLARAFRLLTKPFWSLMVVLVLLTPLASIVSSVTGMIGMVIGFILAAVLAAVAGEAGAVAGGVLVMLFFTAASMLGMVLVATYFVSVPVLVSHEHLGPFAALGRSYRIANANFKSHFAALYVLLHIPTFFGPVAMLVTGLLISVMKFIDPTMNVIISSLVGNLVSVACFGLAACLGTLTYLDGRCRLEAFDLLVLARHIGLEDELARALNQGPTAVAAQFPDYTAQRPAPVMPAASPGAATVLTPPSAPVGFPDYSAPPPEALDGK
ncbi:MAG: hypothetical protein ACYC7E_07370 [Armatimonadota bacterium]